MGDERSCSHDDRHRRRAAADQCPQHWSEQRTDMTTVNSGETLVVHSGETSDGVVVMAGGTLNVASGVLITNTGDSGVDNISGGGVASNTTISLGGVRNVDHLPAAAE